LQRLTYFGLKIVVFPVQIGSGLMYYFFDELGARGLPVGLGAIAFVHVAGTYALVVFVLVHVYLTTTGTTLWSNVRAMVTGWEEVEMDEADAGTSPTA
jgi:thiosulfate reductase cytochrome b subunit